MTIVVYGDFNCPYSALASVRVDRLVARGADVEWRAVEHDTDIPPPSRPVTGELAELLEREVAEITELAAAADDAIAIRQPLLQPNTATAIRAFASLKPAEAHDARRTLFTALWQNGCDIGAQPVVRDLTGGAGSPGADAVVSAWREAWLSLGRPMVPMLVVPGEQPSRGLHALARLADLANGPSR